jgi:hypothetical protein
MGEVVCAWFEKIPVVEKENGNAARFELCYILLMREE